MVIVSIDVPANQIWWFGDWRPRELGAECTHMCHHLVQDVIAWGPTLEEYELRRCQDCGCRGWFALLEIFQPLRPSGYLGLAVEWLEEL